MHTSDFDEIITFPVGDANYPPDDSQQKVIKAINNTVVSAGAGSGKTEVLANRFAYLLMTDPDLHVRNILAITFTKKAAAEIYARVFKKLNDYKNTLSEERFEGKYIGENKPVNLAKRALDEFSDARIQTLDSYSNDVVKLAVARYGIKPDYSVGDPSSDINFMARNFVLRYINNEDFADAYKTYSKVGKIEEFAKTYFADPVLNYTSIATENGWFTDNLKIQENQILEWWNNFFTADDGKEDAENLTLKKCFRMIFQRYTEEENKVTNPLEENPKKIKTYGGTSYFKKAADAISSVKAKYGIDESEELDFSEFKISINEISDISTVKERITPFIDWLECINEIKGQGVNSKLRPFVDSLKTNNKNNLIGMLMACCSFIENHNATEQLFLMADIFLEEVNSKKKRDGILSFKDISELALRVLREQDDIREQQKSSIKKIMIDEFQDNNDDNRKLLFLISGNDENTSAKDCESGEHIDESKLFFVGDEKQSIYKFRGADVSVFNGLKNTLKGKGDEQVLYDMNNNYRSDPELLKAFNELFGDDPNNVNRKKAKQRPEKAQEQFYAIPSLFYFDEDNYVSEQSKIPEYEAMYLKEYKDKTGNKKSNYATKPYKDNDTYIEDIVAPIDLAEKDENSKYKNIRIHACILNSGANKASPESDENSENTIKEKVDFSDKKKENLILNESETTAYFITKKIRELVNNGASYSDFAILDCTRTHRNDLQKFLTMENIPFSVDVQKNIFSDGIVNDFYNFLRICIYPNDSNSFTAFLLSPFVCMSQQGVQNVMSVIFDKNGKTKMDEDGNETIQNFTTFSDDFKLSDFDLSDIDKEKYKNAEKFYKEEKLNILSSSITRTIEHLWYDTGYFYETKLNDNAKIYGEQFDLLYQIAIQAENQGKNIEWFIDQLALTKNAEQSFNPTEDADLETDDVHYPLERQNAVTIMTIHQSKGLEFNNVFVTGIFDNPKPDKSASVYFEKQTGVSVKTPVSSSYNYFFLRNKDDADKKSLAEQKRLIYVAITRARHEVFLVGDFAESDILGKLGENQNTPIMQKLLRYYYFDENEPYKNGLYQNNDYSDETLTAMCNTVPAEEPYYNDTEKAPFDFIKINPVSYKARTATQKSVREQRDELKEKLGNLFYTDYQSHSKNAEDLIPREAVSRNEKPLQKTSSPSKLEELEHQTISETSPLAKQIEEINTIGANPAYAELNSFFKTREAASTDEQIDSQSEDSEKELEPTARKSEFTRGTFGTMAHAYLEHWVKTGGAENAENPTTFDSEVSKSLDENFDEIEHQKLSEICKTMALNFANSPLGKLVNDAKTAGRICKAENNFKMMLDGTLFNGSIDLFIENTDGTFSLVDYKTDEYIHPEKYFEQQMCYKNAIEKIYGINVSKCYLYFLRFDKEVEITEEVEGTKL